MLVVFKKDIRLAVGGLDVHDFKVGEKFDLPEDQAIRHIEKGNCDALVSPTEAPAGKAGDGGAKVTDWNKKNVGEIKAFLDGKGVLYDVKANKPTLVEVATFVEEKGISAVEISSLSDAALLEIIAENSIAGEFNTRDEMVAAIEAHFKAQGDGQAA